MSRTASIASFDLWGIVPDAGESACNFKLCELAGRRGLNPKENVDGTEQLLMREASIPVPFFVCLYFSAGFAAYMTARFQLNRRESPLENKVEYARQAFGIATEAVPPQLNTGLDGVEIECDDEPYFPPRMEEGNSGSRYREVGFLNVNWQASFAHGSDRASFGQRICPCPAAVPSREPAKFNDGRMDMYRLKFRSLVKSLGPRYQTDKRERMRLTYRGAKGQGIFFQWDGEARFAFSPSGDPFNINIRKAPLPRSAPRPSPGFCNSWPAAWTPSSMPRARRCVARACMSKSGLMRSRTQTFESDACPVVSSNRPRGAL
mmetsp:Transcript_98878/g.317022  ORF Transcript_98878/g.317022 Transcript_98878/m.317022 type:complete len:319 (-) Transcript_98878:55-1011(-)